MQNYATGTIVPVGTKIVRIEESNVLEVWRVYIIKKIDQSYVKAEWSDGFYSIESFAPYIEEDKQVETNWLPTYVALKDMPWISKGSVIVCRSNGIVLNQADDNYSNNPSSYIIDYLDWLLKEHPEDFKKIN